MDTAEQGCLDRIRDEFPQLTWRTHRYVTHGWDHVVIILDGRLVFRLPKQEPYLTALRDEVRLLAHLEPRAPVGIPDYRYVSRNMRIAGYGMLGGEELTPTLFSHLSDADRSTVADKLAAFLTALHATPRNIINECHVPDDTPAAAYADLVQRVQDRLLPRLNDHERRLVGEYLAELREALTDSYHAVLTHSDLTDDHVLWDAAAEQVNILDFSDRCVGDPATDFAGLLAYGDDFVHQVLAHYEGEKDANLLRRAHLYFKRIPLYIMMDALDGFPCAFDDGYAMFKERFAA